MDLDEIYEREPELVKDVKKTCLMCMGRSRLASNRGAPEKEKVQVDLKELYSLYEDKYNKLRQANGTVEEIKAAGDNKRFILDVQLACKNCERDVDRANRAMPQLK